MPQVGFEPTISVFQWAKIVHALDRAAIVNGSLSHCRFHILKIMPFPQRKRERER
jgi:hypothetical protein